jgi:hypothetical protein
MHVRAGYGGGRCRTPADRPAPQCRPRPRSTARRPCALQPNGERHLRSEPRLRLARLYPPSLLAETLNAIAAPAAAISRSTSCATSTRKKSCPPGETPAPTWPARSRRLAAATRQGVPDKVRQQIEHELALIAELQYEAYFLTVYDIVNFARGREDPLPGARLGGQLGGVLRARHHRGRPGAARTCCSSASSRRSATSRPTSTSTSSTSGARRSSSTSTPNTAASAPRWPPR